MSNTQFPIGDQGQLNKIGSESQAPIKNKSWEEVKNALESLKTKAEQFGHAAVELLPTRTISRLQRDIAREFRWEVQKPIQYAWEDLKEIKLGRAVENLELGKTIGRLFDKAIHFAQEKWEAVIEKTKPADISHPPSPPSRPDTQGPTLSVQKQETRRHPPPTYPLPDLPKHKEASAAAPLSERAPPIPNPTPSNKPRAITSPLNQPAISKQEAPAPTQPLPQNLPKPVSAPAIFHSLPAERPAERVQSDVRADLLSTAPPRLMDLLIPETKTTATIPEAKLIKKGEKIADQLKKLMKELDEELASQNAARKEAGLEGKVKERKLTLDKANDLIFKINKVANSDVFKQIKRASVSEERLGELQQRLQNLVQMPRQLKKISDLEMKIAQDIPIIAALREPAEKATEAYNQAVAALKVFNQKNPDGGGDKAKRKNLQSAITERREVLLRTRAEMQKIVDQYQADPQVTDEAILERHELLNKQLEIYFPNLPEGLQVVKGLVSPSPVLRDLAISGSNKNSVMTEPILSEFTFLQEVSQRKNFYLKALNKPHLDAQEKLLLLDLVSNCNEIEGFLNNRLSQFNNQLEIIDDMAANREAKTDALIASFYSKQSMDPLIKFLERGGDLQRAFDNMGTIEPKLTEIIGKNDASIGKHKPSIFVQRLLKYPFLMKECLKLFPSETEIHASFQESFDRMSAISKGVNETAKQQFMNIWQIETGAKEGLNIEQQFKNLKAALKRSPQPTASELGYLNKAYEELRMGLAMYHAIVVENKTRRPLLEAALEGKISIVAKRYDKGEVDAIGALESEIAKLEIEVPRNEKEMQLRKAILGQVVLTKEQEKAIKEELNMLKKFPEKIPIDTKELNKVMNQLFNLKNK